MGALSLKQESLFDLVVNSYSEFKGHRYFGIFDFSRPVVVVRDPEIIKQITVKDFEYFLDHRPFLMDMENEPLFGRSLFMLTGQRWRDMRATLSPTFTGSKMRQMFQLVVECSDQATDILLKEAKESSKPIVREMKEVFSRYTTDVIATSAFGIQVNSLKDRDNEFYQMGTETTGFTGITVMLKLLVIFVVPKLAASLKMGLFTKRQNQFYRDLVHGTIKHREKNGIIRPDMIHLLIEARKGNLKREAAVGGGGTAEGFATVKEVKSEDLQGAEKTVWDDDDLTAQCFLFFLAGFDTSSTLLSCAATELMENPEIQQTLFEECVSIREQLDGKSLTYDVLQKMPYMDMVVSETLRKWPPGMLSDRQCVKPYELTDETGRTYKLNKGDGIWIPVIGIHRDPEFYPDPNRFDPERFSEERKGSIKPFTYLPFGSGPRNCIGSRFALMECKALIYNLLLNFSFEPAPNSIIPLRMGKTSFAVTAENGYNLILKPRS